MSWFFEHTVLFQILEIIYWRIHHLICPLVCGLNQMPSRGKEHKFERGIRVKLNPFVRLDIIQSKFRLKTVRAFYYELLIFLSFLCHVSYAQTANIIATARRDKNWVEVPQANWAAILKNELQVLGFREFNYKLNILLLNWSFDPHLVSFPDLVCVTALFSFQIMQLLPWIPKLLIEVLYHWGLQRRIPNLWV